MRQQRLATYTDIAEVRTVTGAATCNQLLSEGWVLLGVYPLTTVAEMTEGAAGDGQEQKKQDTQRYVRRLVGYVVRRRRSCRLKERDVGLTLPLKSKSRKYRARLVFREHHPVIKDQADAPLIPFGTGGSLFY
jgi:hypothetical protein